ncbi:DNA mismatch repair endonuclease MutH [Minicystis rosea]|nr:DNA mismatch repair endonuclease MutH [Minicystis rosea]
MIDPPRDEAELAQRAHALEGRTLGDLAAAVGVSFAGGGLRTKGKLGEVIERALGATGGSAAVPDFPALGVELKTIPLDARGEPRESTFVCAFSLADADRAEWATSWARRKLARVLWVPIDTQAGSAIETRRIGAPVLWRPTPAQEAVLAEDFDTIMGLVGIGRVEALDARTGRFLQARPKAAHGRVRTRAYGPEGEPIEALPRGFYLRTRFTGAILRDPAALPA